MAYVEVTVPDPDPNEEGATFVKFEAIGETFAGIFMGRVETTNKWDRKQWNYKFKTPNGVEIITPSSHLAQLFDASNDAKGLQRGNRIVAKYDHDVPMKGLDRDGRQKQPMKYFKLKVDSDPRPAQGQQSQQRQAPPPQQKQPPAQRQPPPPANDGADDFADFDDVPI